MLKPPSSWEWFLWWNEGGLPYSPQYYYCHKDISHRLIWDSYKHKGIWMRRIMRQCLNCQYLILQWASSSRFLTIYSKFPTFTCLTELVLNHVIHIFRVRAISQSSCLWIFSCILFQKVSASHASSLYWLSKYFVISFSTSSTPGVSTTITSHSQVHQSLNLTLVSFWISPPPKSST